MVAKAHFVTAKREIFKRNGHGIHAKRKSSKLKTSKNYVKRYVGQGKN